MQRAIYGLNDLRALELRAQNAGIDLMPRAAAAVLGWVAQRFNRDARILVAAGPGNNGGDALIAARLLTEAGFSVEVLLAQTPTSSATQRALDHWEALAAPTYRLLPQPYPRPDLVIDGLFGIGISRSFSPAWCDLIERLNALGAPILALDTPSGLDPYRGATVNAAIRAQATLTFLCHKPGLFTGSGADLAGQVTLARLDHPGWSGSEPEGALNHPSAARLARRHDSHKGCYGTVAVLGGARGMLGAVLLAGRAALQAGAGKVVIAALDTRLAVDPSAPELMIRDAAAPLPDCDVLALGPGLGQDAAALQLLMSVLDCPQPLVLDADALNLLARHPELAQRCASRAAVTILTPHPAEAARLLALGTAEVQADRLQVARALARRFHCVVILKGAGSLIVGADGYYHINTTGGPALAAAGQGDVLTGLCAAMLAQGLEAFAAASLAVYAHGRIGDEYSREAGGPLGLTAAHSASRIGHILNQLLPSEHLPWKEGAR